MPRPLIPGVYVPTVAFYQPNEDLDLPTIEAHAVYLAQAGITGIVTQGSNGEAVHLDREERKLVTQHTRRALDAAGFTSVPVIVGCGSSSTRETIRFSQDAAEAGGDYTILLPPCYYKGVVSNDTLLDHFRAAADASPLPVLIYNFPGVSGGIDLTSDDLLALAKHPNIVGVKLTCMNTGKLARITSQVKPEFRTFGGSADFTLQTLIAGGSGVIAGLGNLMPRSCVRVMDLYQKGKVEEAQQLQGVVARADWLALSGGLVGTKSALQTYRGYGNLPRRPCVPPSAEEAERIKEYIREGMEMEKSLGGTLIL